MERQTNCINLNITLEQQMKTQQPKKKKNQNKTKIGSGSISIGFYCTRFPGRTNWMRVLRCGAVFVCTFITRVRRRENCVWLLWSLCVSYFFFLFDNDLLSDDSRSFASIYLCTKIANKSTNQSSNPNALGCKVGTEMHTVLGQIKRQRKKRWKSIYRNMWKDVFVVRANGILCRTQSTLVLSSSLRDRLNVVNGTRW